MRRALALAASSAVAILPPAPIMLGSGWLYRGATGRTWSPVTIPNDFNPRISVAGSDKGAVAWYRVAFRGPRRAAGRSWSVHFESVRRRAVVWLNGRRLGVHLGPYVPFSFPATTVVPGKRNVLTVRVDNVRGPTAFPEDWWDWGGITGPVALEPAGRLSLDDLGVTSELGCGHTCGDLLVQGTLRNTSALALPADIVVRVTSPSGATSVTRRPLGRLAPGGSTAVSLRVPVRRPLALWSPHSPALYRVQVDVVAGDRVEQTHTLQTGMRSVQVRGGVLYVNGRRLWLHGAAIHEDVQGRGAALSDGDIDTIVSNLRSVGANITRAHYLLSPRLLDALDAAGIMVWAQPPVDHADPVLATSAGRSRALAELRSTLIGDRSHPSVIVDSIGNELTPVPDSTPGTRSYLTQAIALARKLNPTLPVALDTYCYPGYPAQRIYSKLNVIGISSYFGWYPGQPGHSIASFSAMKPFLQSSHRRYPNQALVVSEFGAESRYDGPATTRGSYQFQSGYLERTYAVLDQLPFMNGAIYWTLQEFAEGPGWVGGASLPPGVVPDGLHHKGLIAYDGTEKPAFSVAARVFAQLPPYIH